MEYYFYIVFIVTLGISIFAIINLIALKVMTQKPQKLEKEPFVSVLIPARNEEKYIEGCVKSLLDQDYKNYEIIVLDDHSEDRTQEIVSNLAKNNPKVKLVIGKPLPSDWLGKQYACYQLAKEAKGEYLLFTDADTIHTKRSISWGITNALHYTSDLLSCFPQQKITGFGTGIVIPSMYIGSLFITPVFLIHKTHNRRISAACGQYMIFNKDAYWKIGGHEAVKDTPTEDWIFAKIIHDYKLKEVFLDGTKYISTMMYETFYDAFTSYARHTYVALEKNLFFVLGSVFFVLSTFVCPTAAILLGFFNKFVFFAALLPICVWLINAYDKKLPLWTGLLFPISMLVLSSLMVYGYLKSNLSEGLVWKGRLIK